jgi:hypothetical protein
MYQEGQFGRQPGCRALAVFAAFGHDPNKTISEKPIAKNTAVSRFYTAKFLDLETLK